MKKFRKYGLYAREDMRESNQNLKNSQRINDSRYDYIIVESYIFEFFQFNNIHSILLSIQKPRGGVASLLARSYDKSLEELRAESVKIFFIITDYNVFNHY